MVKGKLKIRINFRIESNSRGKSKWISWSVFVNTNLPYQGDMIVSGFLLSIISLIIYHIEVNVFRTLFVTRSSSVPTIGRTI